MSPVPAGRRTMEECKGGAPRSPKVLTDADFVESTGYLVSCPPEPGTCLLIIAHTNLYGTEPTEDEYDSCEARNFLEMLLTVAQEFQEIRIGLLNHLDVQASIRRLPIAPSGSFLYAEALVCLGPTEWRHIVCGDETPESVRLWLRGVLLATGLRSTISRDDLNVRLAYELGQTEKYSFSDARWDAPHFRSKLYKAAKQELDRLSEKWALRVE
jgi:hypothetical protein